MCETRNPRYIVPGFSPRDAMQTRDDWSNKLWPRAVKAHRGRACCWQCCLPRCVPVRAGIVVKELTWAPKVYRRYAPGFHQKQSKRPKIFRRYAPELCKGLRARRPKTAFPAPLRGQGAHMGAMSQNAFISAREGGTTRVPRTSRSQGPDPSLQAEPPQETRHSNC